MPDLPNAIPEFRLDADQLLREVGYLQLYNRQLQQRLLEMAAQINELHDKLTRKKPAKKVND